MKRLLVLLLPIIIIFLAFRPVPTHTITGLVTDESGQPIPAATVSLKGSSQGISTDSRGTYRITLGKSSGVLLFSAAGFITIEERIGGRKTINVTLKSAAVTMQEVVVTALGIKRTEKAQGYAVTKADPNVILPHSAPTVQNGLQGRAPGSHIQNSQGTPGSNTRIQIRGVSSSPSVVEYKSEENGVDKDLPKPDFNREGYDKITENAFLKVSDNPLSTFSIDVDAASYSNVRRFLHQGSCRPPAQYVLKKW